VIKLQSVKCVSRSGSVVSCAHYPECRRWSKLYETLFTKFQSAWITVIQSAPCLLYTQL